MDRSTWAEIDLDNLSNNINEIKKFKSSSARIMAIVKANAYGHGAIQVTRELKRQGVDMFGVAIPSEAIELRNAGIDDEILLLGYVNRNQIESVIEHNITFTVYNLIGAREISKVAERLGRRVKVHIKVDSGMNRLGFRPGDKSLEEILEISRLKNIDIDGYFSHLSTSDDIDKRFSMKQLESFLGFLDRLKSHGLKIKNRHISNSGAIIDMPEFNLDVLRPGIMLYGYYPSEYVSRENIKLKRVMKFKTHISNLKWIDIDESVGYGRTFIAKKRTKVATVPIGYADGFTRLLSEKISLSIGSEKAKLIGNICMDQSMLDCSHIEDIRIEDEVVVFGEGKNLNSADDLADAIGTINYEILCMVSKRVPRIYVSSARKIEVVDYLIG